MRKLYQLVVTQGHDVGQAYNWYFWRGNYTNWSSSEIYWFLQWTRLLSTWKGIILFAAGLALVTAVMHVFIIFSQSERSSSARAARDRMKRDWGLMWNSVYGGTADSSCSEFMLAQAWWGKFSLCLCSLGTSGVLCGKNCELPRSFCSLYAWQKWIFAFA